ncbi:hypothetical protein BX600DRAFT_450083 [Xylariales sp. PMI_506]|nr:hypothetical protein BX600DRAFT_450083 [Xylariales sp. PMI_506]
MNTQEVSNQSPWFSFRGFKFMMRSEGNNMDEAKAALLNPEHLESMGGDLTIHGEEVCVLVNVCTLFKFVNHYSAALEHPSFWDEVSGVWNQYVPPAVTRYIVHMYTGARKSFLDDQQDVEALGHSDSPLASLSGILAREVDNWRPVYQSSNYFDRDTAYESSEGHIDLDGLDWYFHADATLSEEMRAFKQTMQLLLVQIEEEQNEEDEDEEHLAHDAMDYVFDDDEDTEFEGPDFDPHGHMTIYPFDEEEDDCLSQYVGSSEEPPSSDEDSEANAAQPLSGGVYQYFTVPDASSLRSSGSMDPPFLTSASTMLPPHSSSPSSVSAEKMITSRPSSGQALMLPFRPKPQDELGASVKTTNQIAQASSSNPNITPTAGASQGSLFPNSSGPPRRENVVSSSPPAFHVPLPRYVLHGGRNISGTDQLRNT